MSKLEEWCATAIVVGGFAIIFVAATLGTAIGHCMEIIEDLGSE